MPTFTASLPPALFAALGLLAVAGVFSPLLARRRRAAGIVHLILVSAAGLLLLVVGFRAVLGGGMEEARSLRFGSVPIPFLLDGLSGLFLALIAFMAVMSAIYAVRYLDHHPEYGVGDFYVSFPLFILGMALLVVVDDLSVGFTIAWQIMTVASFTLIRYEHRNPENIRAAKKYLLLMELAWLLILAGGLAAGGSIGDSLHTLARNAAGLDGAGLFIVFALLLVGFGLKAGVFPLGQLWLPDAHSVAPSPVSALLSGVMLKTGIFGLLRVFFFFAPAVGRGFDPFLWGGILAAIGAATLFIGTLQSVKQSDAKRLLAYSSIGQIGYIVLAMGVSLGAAGSPDPNVRRLAAVAILGAIFHVLNHAAFKGLLFLTSGSLLYATGTKDLNKLGGLIRWMPVSAAVAAIASLSIAGMPPTSGFASKWTIITSSLLAGDVSVFLVLFGVVALFTSAVTLACYVKFFGLAFTASGSEWTVGKPIREVPALMLLPKLILCGLIIVQGLFPAVFLGWIVSALRHSNGFALANAFRPSALGGTLDASLLGLRVRDLFGTPINAAVSPLLALSLLVLALLLASLLRRSAGSRERTAPTWLCGYQLLNEKNRFTDRGMFAALKHFFRWTGGK
jgi:hydrogenase-4 component B